ncbi:MAG: class I SAM-dependent methyltransferase [Acidimicrobiales bacterium]
MWRSYFPNAVIYGLDVEEKHLHSEPRIVVLQGDQADKPFLKKLTERHGPFDLIVDDGSHLGTHQRASFEALFLGVRPGGIYAIEDLETAYWSDWEGGPPGTPGTAVDLAKGLLDDVNVGPRPVASVHLYPGIVFVHKAAVAQRARPPLPAPR